MSSSAATCLFPDMLYTYYEMCYVDVGLWLIVMQLWWSVIYIYIYINGSLQFWCFSFFMRPFFFLLPNIWRPESLMVIWDHYCTHCLFFVYNFITVFFFFGPIVRSPLLLTFCFVVARLFRLMDVLTKIKIKII
jgi:hypothetical protein